MRSLFCTEWLKVAVASLGSPNISVMKSLSSEKLSSFEILVGSVSSSITIRSAMAISELGLFSAGFLSNILVLNLFLFWEEDVCCLKMGGL